MLVVVTTTGTGWVDPAASDSLEYEFNGDTAMVAMQYSYLPSWMSFLVDQVKARDAGRALFDAVYGAWAQLPPESRPQLYVFGESLGTFGGEAAFSGLADIENRTDGVLWAGPPNFNELWRRASSRTATPARPEWLPVYDGRPHRPVRRRGRRPRPAARVRGATPRLVYLQNASDPIVWWSPRLILDHPDWLRGERGPDVSQGMVWLPFVTFWQVTADLVFADRRARRARAQVRGRLRRRLGRGRPAARLDRRPTPSGCGRWSAGTDAVAAGARVTTSAARRTRNRLVSGAVVVVLAAINVTDHLLHPPWWVRALEGAALLAWARLDGLSWSQLGLGRDRLASGCRWALGAIGVVAGVYVVGVLLPLTRPAFQDVRYDLPLAEALRTAFVVIPFGTVALEELAFRSVLWGMSCRGTCGSGRCWSPTSVLFGLLARHPGAARAAATNRGVSDAVGGAGSAAVVVGHRRRSRRSAGWSSASCAGAAAACWPARARTGRPMPSACCSGWWPGGWIPER